MSEEVSTFDWDSLKKELEKKGMKFSILSTEMPTQEPIRMASSYTEGLYPTRLNHFYKQTDKE